MDAFVGTWKGGKGDTENLQAYADALGRGEVAQAYEAGCELTYTKEGDCYIAVMTVGGAQTFKQKYGPNGGIEDLAPIPGVEVKFVYKVDGNKMEIEGTYAGLKTKSVNTIEGNTVVMEKTANDVTMKMKLTKV